MKRSMIAALAVLTALILLAGMAQATQETVVLTTPEQTGAIALATEQVEAEIAKLAESTKNLWVKEMLTQATITQTAAANPDKKGAIAVTITVTYPLLASGVTAKTKFDGNEAEAFVRAAIENAIHEVATYDVQSTITYREGKEPTFKWHSSKGFSGFKSTLTTKAKAASASFAVKPMVSALSMYVFSHPVRGAKIDLTSGPHAMKISATAPKYERMLTRVIRNAITRAAYDGDGPNTDGDALERFYDQEIVVYGETYAASKKHATDHAVSLTFDPFALIAGKDSDQNAGVLDYRMAYLDVYNDYFDGLVYLTTELPDLPALQQPETERLIGGTRGAKISIRAKKGDGNWMVRLIKDDKVVALCFVRDGERINVYLSAGTYILQTGRGSIWYGEDELFGPDIIATYSYDSIRIGDSDGSYSLTLSSVDAEDSDDAMDELTRDGFIRK